MIYVGIINGLEPTAHYGDNLVRVIWKMLIDNVTFNFVMVKHF